jgi:hypothetical protein
MLAPIIAVPSIVPRRTRDRPRRVEAPLNPICVACVSAS